MGPHSPAQSSARSLDSRSPSTSAEANALDVDESSLDLLMLGIMIGYLSYGFACVSLYKWIVYKRRLGRRVQPMPWVH